MPCHDVRAPALPGFGGGRPRRRAARRPARPPDRDRRDGIEPSLGRLSGGGGGDRALLGHVCPGGTSRGGLRTGTSGMLRSRPGGSRSSRQAARSARVSVPAVHRGYPDCVDRGARDRDGPPGSPARPSSSTSVVSLAAKGSIGYATSSGLACGDTVEAALARALLEILERDAFMIVWASRLTLPLVESAGPGSRELVRSVWPPLCRRRPVGHSPAAHDPRHRPRAGRVSGGIGRRGRRSSDGRAGLAQSARRGLRRSLCRRQARVAPAGPRSRAGGEQIASFDDHILYYADHDRAGAAAFLDASDDRTPAESILPLEGARPAEWVAALCDRVDAAGSSAYAVDVTSPDVAELGLVVTRVVAPGLCGLDVSHDARFLGGRRLYEAAAAARAAARLDVRGRRQPRPPSVPMSSVLPTSQFASLVHGANGVPLDDLAEALHEGSRLYPNVAPERLDVLLELTRGSGPERERCPLEQDPRAQALDRASAARPAERIARRRPRQTTLGVRRGASTGRHRGALDGACRRLRSGASRPPPGPLGGRAVPARAVRRRSCGQRPRSWHLPLQPVSPPARPARVVLMAGRSGRHSSTRLCSTRPPLSSS